MRLAVEKRNWWFLDEGVLLKWCQGNNRMARPVEVVGGGRREPNVQGQSKVNQYRSSMQRCGARRPCFVVLTCK